MRTYNTNFEHPTWSQFMLWSTKNFQDNLMFGQTRSNTEYLLSLCASAYFLVVHDSMKKVSLYTMTFISFAGHLCEQ